MGILCFYHNTGVPTAQVAVQFAKRCGLHLPNFTAVAAVLSGELPIEVRVCQFKLFIYHPLTDKSCRSLIFIRMRNYILYL